MRVSTRFSDSIHLLAYIKIYADTKLTSYAIEGDKPLLAVDPKTNPDCIVGGNIQTVLKQYYQDAQTAAEARLAKTSLQDVVDNILVEQAKKDAHK